MRLGKVFIYLLILLVVAGYVYFVEVKHKAKQEALKKQEEQILDVPKTEIVKTILKKTDAPPIVLEKQAGTWKMVQPIETKADEFAVDSLLVSLTDGAREKVISENDVDWKEYGLEKPRFMVTVKTEKSTTEVAFGEKNPAGTSYYVRVDDQPELLLATDTLKNSLDRSVLDLRDKSIVDVSPENIQRVTYVFGDREIALKRVDATHWRMEEPQEMQVKQSLISQDLRTVANLRAKDVIDDPKTGGDPYGLAEPKDRIVLAGDQLESTLLLGKRVEGEDWDQSRVSLRYVKTGDKETVYVVNSQMLDAMNRDVEALRDRSLLGFQPARVQEFSLELGTNTWAAVRNDAKQWKLTKPEEREVGDAWRVNSVLWDLTDLEWQEKRELTEAERAELGLDNPDLVARFTLDDSDITTVKMAWTNASLDGPDQAGQGDEKVAPGTEDSEEAVPHSDDANGPSRDQEEMESEAKGPDAAGSPPPGEQVYALVESGESSGSSPVFILDPQFLDRLKADLERMTDEGDD